ncbi:eukaryotic translation initiation factor 4E [Sporobolomyces koalae]|uniref:eukaryotic translation initiation factor 4E n=1 Tax=Sporobolomyces koalae TaxID=500713 RepID=UPI003172015F
MSNPTASPPAPQSNLPAAAAQASHAAVKTAIATEDHEPGTAKDVTVLSDPTNFNVKHPLYSPWTLWFDSASKQDKAKSWEEALSKVISFQSVEEFWGLYNNIIAPSHLSPNSNYYLFKEGVKPAWEDSANAKGGKWSVQLPRGKYASEIDTFWLYTMLAAIGETFETPYSEPPASASEPPVPPTPLPSTFSNEITGVIVSARKAFFRINLWTRTSSPEDEARIKDIGKHFKYGVLNFEKGGINFSEKDKVSSDVEFVSHKDSQAKYGTKVNKWTV